MVQASIVNYYYEPSRHAETQGKKTDVKRRYPGYNITVARNGYFVVTKPSKLEVTLSWGKNHCETFNMRNDILNLYRREKASVKLLETFVRDVKGGTYKIFMDENNSYIIK